MTVKFFLCAASGKKCDRKRKIKDEIALKISFFVWERFKSVPSLAIRT